MISPAMRTLLLSALLFSTLAAAQNHNSGPTKFNEATIAQLQADMASGKVTSVELTQFYITRILALDQKVSGSEFRHSAQSRCAGSGSQCRCHAQAWRHRPLLGIPVLLKDNIDTGDKMEKPRPVRSDIRGAAGLL